MQCNTLGERASQFSNLTVGNIFQDEQFLRFGNVMSYNNVAFEISTHEGLVELLIYMVAMRNSK